MNKFDEVFIQGKPFSEIHISKLDRLAIQQFRFERKIRNLKKKLYS